MKKVILCVLILLGAGFAQAQTGGGLKLGLKGGLNISNMIASDADEDFNTGYKAGFHAGIFTNLPIAGGLSLAPELLYSQKGYKTDGSSLIGGQYEYSVTTNFVELPVLLNIHAGTNFNIHLGPQLSFLLSTTESFREGSAEYRRTVQEENDQLRKSLLGGVIGVGFNVGSRLDLHGRYSLDIQRNENGTSATPRYRNQVFQIGLGFAL